MQFFIKHRFLSISFILYPLLCNNPIQSTKIQHRYLPLLDTVESIRVFEEKERHHFLFFGEKRIERNCQTYRINQQTEYTSSMDWVYTITMQVITGKLPIESYFLKLLGVRIIMQIFTNTSIEHYDGTKCFIIPTDNDLFDYIYQDPRYKDGILIAKKRQEITIQYEEMLTFLIRQTFDMIRADHVELSQKTKKILRACKSLHPVLAKRNDLIKFPYRDRLYQLIKPHIMALAKEDTPNDFHPYENLILTLTMLKTPLSDFEELIKYGLKQPGCSHILRKKMIKSLKLKKQEIDLSNSDGHIFRGHFVEKTRILRYETLVKEKMAGKREMTDEEYYLLSNKLPIQLELVIKLTDYEYWIQYRENANNPAIFDIHHPDHNSSIWKHPLPSIDFLFSDSEQTNESVPTINPIPASRFAKSPTPQLQQSVSPDLDMEDAKVEEDRKPFIKTISQPIVPSTPQASHPPKSTSHQPTLVEAYQSKEKVNHISPKNKKKPSQITSTDTEQKFKSFYDRALPRCDIHFEGYGDYPMPRGTRTQYGYMIENPCPIKELPNKYQNIVDAIFNPKQQCKVTFKDYRSVIEKGLSGKLIPNVGSHHILKDSKDHTIGGIFKHNDNQTYGKKAIPYLTFYVLYLGGRPAL